MKKKILITGNLGFIGSNLIRQLFHEKKDYEIIGIDCATDNAGLNEQYFHRDHRFYIADICDANIMDRIFKLEKPNYIIHLAAETHVDDSMHSPVKFMNTNVIGTQVLVNNALKYGVERFLYCSTDEVYGSFDGNDNGWTEESPIAPRNFYSVSKANGEMIVKAAGNLGLNYLISRSANTYGPRQRLKLIPQTIKSIFDETSINVYGKGEQVRDWVSVQAHGDALMAILENGKIGEAYNVSAGCEMMNIEMVQKVCSILGKGHNQIKFIDDPRKGMHDFKYKLDSKKLRSLGWLPKLSFKISLERTIEWYANNKFFLKG